MGGQYEVKDGATKKYYSIAGMMVAMNDGTGLQYLLTDHLGSTVAVTNSSGTLTSQQRYLPFGAARTIPNSPILGTDFTYTGQRKLDDGMGGVMDYKARFYSVGLGRFLQPDTIIPDQSNPQSWNRFSYVSGNPLKYTDPTGHMQVCERGDEGIEGELHSSSCGSGANTKQIEKAFDKKHSGKGYSEYYAKLHEVVIDLEAYLENVNIEYEKETDAMRDKRISRLLNRLIASVDSARLTGQILHYDLRQDAWESDARFPKILGGGYIIDNSSGGLGDGVTQGSGELASARISEIVKYYTRTPSLHYGPPRR